MKTVEMLSFKLIVHSFFENIRTKPPNLHSFESKTATEDVDFTFESVSFVLLPSDQEVDVPLTILNDNIPEGLESFAHYNRPTL